MEDWAAFIAKKAQDFLNEIDKEIDARLAQNSEEDTELEHSPEYYWTKQELMKILQEYRKVYKNVRR